MIKKGLRLTLILGPALCLGLLMVHCSKKEAPSEPAKAPREPIAQETSVVVQNGEAPDIEFEEIIHDFGKIDQGEKIEHTFKFKNTGKGELIIEKVKSS